ncbi:MAG TPA: CDF family Co(II)/Ni(II) efflux transporter DmeF [Usitatibacter sp.]|nr:CDF family Co(II)/Ni(II) efflux transporter DmeF [Usitatibacter sp.]
MAIHDLSGWQHNHSFDRGNRAGERRTWVVVGITAVTMVAEIVAGMLTGSMALLADGWHMATHVVALSIAGFAYLLARRYAGDERFAFGTWKIEVLGAFTSALLLGVVAFAMVWESTARLLHPEPIRYVAALAVAVIGLVVNLASAAVLHGPQALAHDDHDHLHHHDHEHEHEHGHDHAHALHADEHHRDLNLKSAYAHVLADAFTSVLAIGALAAGLWGGWRWMDPLMGIVGAAVIAWWSKGLIADSARVLLDREMDSPIVGRIREAVQCDGDAEIADLHVWRVGRASYAAVMSIVAERPLTPSAYRDRVAGIDSLVHVSVEVNRCGAHAKCP